MFFEHSQLVALHNFAPQILECPRYASEENFMGRIVEGYSREQPIQCTVRAAIGLCSVAQYFSNQQLKYKVVVYDAYRPQEAVNDFWRWSQNGDEHKKLQYYPHLQKERLFELGYIAKNSSHTAGNTFDLTLTSRAAVLPVTEVERTFSSGFSMIYLQDGTIDMGTHFDFFGEASHHDSLLVNQEQLQNREILRKGMVKYGFSEYKEEWWHYSFS